jgi:hypothetical protein
VLVRSARNRQTSLVVSGLMARSAMEVAWHPFTPVSSLASDMTVPAGSSMARTVSWPGGLAA